MAATSVKCPKCSSVLKSTRVIPAGATLKCPKCQTAFKTPAEEDDELVEPEFEEAEQIQPASALKQRAAPSHPDDDLEDDDDPPPRRGSKKAADDDDLADLDEVDDLDEVEDDEPRKKRSRDDNDDDDLDDENRPRRKSKRDDDDDEDDKPRKKKKKKKKKGGAGLIIGLAAAGGLIVAVAIGLVVFFMMRGPSVQVAGTWEMHDMRHGGKSDPNVANMRKMGVTMLWDFGPNGDLKVGTQQQMMKVGTYRVSGSTLYVTDVVGGAGGLSSGSASISLNGNELTITDPEQGTERQIILRRR